MSGTEANKSNEMRERVSKNQRPYTNAEGKTARELTLQRQAVEERAVL